MSGLSNDIDFSALSDEDLEKLLEEEKEKRKNFVPQRVLKVAKAGAKKVKKGPEIEEIELD